MRVPHHLGVALAIAIASGFSGVPGGHICFLDRGAELPGYATFDAAAADPYP